MRAGATRPASGPPGAQPQPSGRGAPRLPCAVPNSRGVCRAAAIMASFLARDLPLLSAHAPPRCARSAPARPERPRRRTGDAARRPPFTAAPPAETTIPRGQRAGPSLPPPPSRPGPVVRAPGAVHAGNCSPHHTPHARRPSSSHTGPAHTHATSPLSLLFTLRRAPGPATTLRAPQNPPARSRRPQRGLARAPQDGDRPAGVSDKAAIWFVWRWSAACDPVLLGTALRFLL